MTKGELLEILKDVPDDSEIDIYDLEKFSHPHFRVELGKYIDYDNGRPIVTFETNVGLED